MSSTGTTSRSQSLNTPTVVLMFGVFFASGMAGLIYQVVWSRLLTLVIGVGIFAITTVVCTFMAGLAIGSYVIGRWGDRWRDPLLAYGIIEGIIGLYAALTPWIFEAAQPVYVWGFRSFDHAALNVFRVVLSTAILLFPTALMGGTLPLLARAISGWSEKTATSTGLLYAVNTFGAVAGCFLAGFVLLADLGISGALLTAAAMNVGVAVVVVLSRRLTSPLAASAPVAGLSSARSNEEAFVLAVFFVTGFAALGYEVLWTRALLVYLKSSTYAFSLVLSVYLLGIAAGSSLASWFAGNSKRPLYGLAALQVAVALSVVAGMIAFPTLSQLAMNLIGSTRIDSFARSVAFMFAQAGIVLLLPTIFMGAMFPYGVAAYHRSSRGVSESVGSLYAANTLGNIAGSIVVGFFAISLIGVRHSMIALVAVNLFAAAALVARQTRPMVARALAPAAALVIALAAHSLVSPRLFYNSITTPWNSILYYREGASDTVAVIERGKEKDRALIYSDGRGAAGTSTVHWNLYFGHLPMLLHPNPQEVLHICYGSGNSVLAVTRHDPERVDVVELSPHVREASQYFWTNEGVIDDPRVHLIIEDGRNFLLGTDRTYDVISLEPPNIFTAGVVNLYSKEFYDLARNRLKPGGIMMQWLPTPESSTEDRGRLIRAFTDAFPHVTVWQQLFSTSLLLAGTLEPLSIDVAAIERRMQTDAMKKDIETMRVENVLGFLSFFLLGDDSVRRLVAPHEPVRDDRTVVDFSMPRFIGSGYGLSLYTYAIGDERASPWKVINDRLKEYATWGDSASLIIADPEQARRVDRAIRLRMSGKPGQLAAEAAPADGSAPTGNSPTSPQ